MITTIPAVGRILPLGNVTRFTVLMERLTGRDPDLPGFGVFDGPAGFGKTSASIYAANAFRAHCVRLESCTTQRGFCLAVARELGIARPERTVEGVIHQIADHLADTPGRPLILDEADHLSRRGIIELVRDIHDRAAPAGASIVMIGETGFYESLRRWERVQSRVLDRIRAAPISPADVEMLAARICSGIAVGEELLARVLERAKGSARRAVNQIHDLRERALTLGTDRLGALDLEDADAA